MAVPERQRDQRSIKKWSFLSYDARKNLIFLEHVHNHASVVCTKLRRWVERITIAGFQRNVVTCSKFTQWVRRLGSFVALLAASYPHAHLSSRVPSPWGTPSPRPLFCFPWPSFVSFPGLPWLSEAESSFLPSSPPAPILSSLPCGQTPALAPSPFWETQWIKNATRESALFFKPEMCFIWSASYLNFPLSTRSLAI